MFKIHRPAQDIIPLLHGCDVLCLPSIYEGFSNVIGEAMACGKPVLAGNVSDNSLMVKNGFNGFLFDPKNPSDIADAIVKFYRCRPKERQNMGKRSRDIAEKLLSEELFIKRYEKLFAMKGRIGINPETLVENSVG
jgi:glycosyltransferase involved in cell wall biosynthesis